MQAPVLHHHDIGDTDAERRLFVLHGIYGAGRNWATFARELVERRPDWRVILVDLRLHGHSQGFEPPHTLASCVHDLVELAGGPVGSAAAILGHSFGGKVALMATMALHPRQVWVIDSTPSRRTPGGSAVRMMGILRRLSSGFESRAEAVAALESAGLAGHVARWMATNLELRAGIYRWRFDLDGLESLLNDFFRRDLWDVLEDPPGDAEIHLVRASESDVMDASELERVRALGGPVEAHELHGGHWLHQDNPEGLLSLVAPRLPGASG